jgi:hypothetical protein
MGWALQGQEPRHPASPSLVVISATVKDALAFSGKNSARVQTVSPLHNFGD